MRKLVTRLVITLGLLTGLGGCSILHENCFVIPNGGYACLEEVRRSPLDKPTKVWYTHFPPGYNFYPLAPDESNFMGDLTTATSMVPTPTLPVPIP